VGNLEWQRKFSTIWPSFLAFFVLLSLPHLIRSIQNRRAYITIPGISERLNDRNDPSLVDSGVSSGSGSRVFKNNHRLVTSLQNLCGAIGSVFYWTLPGFNLSVGQRSWLLSPLL
jgi:ferric-chelate reductase